MTFQDLFREKYRKALLAARENDTVETIAGLNELCGLFETQFGSNNGDSIITKASLRNWRNIFDTYIAIIRQYGLKDRRVQKLFGFIEDESVPFLAQILKYGSVPFESIQKADGGIDFSGIMPEEDPSDGHGAGRSAYSAEERGGKKSVEDSPVPVKEEPKNPESVKPVREEPNLPQDEEPQIPAKDEPKAESAKPVQQYPEGATDIAAYDPQSLREFIGQQHIIKPLLKEIAIAKAEGRKHIDNILLFGNPGLGKSTLMKLIAVELGVKLELLDCSQFRNSQQSLKALQNFFMRIGRENDPVVIALDEVHLLNNELQSSLLTLLNNRVYVSPLDIRGQKKVVPIDEFTFIAATTDDDKVLDTIKNRCLRLTFKMVDYTPDEIKRIYINKIAAKGLTIDDDALEICIPRSRGAMRYVNSIVEGLNIALYSDDGKRLSTHITLDTAMKYFEEKGIDPIGLGLKDLEILHVLLEAGDIPLSADVLSARVGLETKVYVSEHERYLIKIGFISVTGRGRSLTPKAKDYLQGGENA